MSAPTLDTLAQAARHGFDGVHAAVAVGPDAGPDALAGAAAAAAAAILALQPTLEAYHAAWASATPAARAAHGSMRAAVVDGARRATVAHRQLTAQMAAARDRVVEQLLVMGRQVGGAEAYARAAAASSSAIAGRS